MTHQPTGQPSVIRRYRRHAGLATCAVSALLAWSSWHTSVLPHARPLAAGFALGAVAAALVAWEPMWSRLLVALCALPLIVRGSLILNEYGADQAGPAALHLLAAYLLSSSWAWTGVALVSKPRA